MDEHRHNRTDPWDDGIYETGRTRPPKNHGGLIAALLVVVIILGGIVSALGVLNVKLFTQLKNRSGEDGQEPVSFVSETEPPETEASSPTLAQQTRPAAAGAENSGFELKPTPESLPNIPQEGGLSLQEIYQKNINSVVSITCTLQSGKTSGTGVIISQSGYIVTNCHVVEGAMAISVSLTDARAFDAMLIGSDAVSDLAVLCISAADLSPAEFGDSGALQVGDSVVAIGDPLGAQFHGTMTNGIVSAINRDVTTGGRTLTLIQTNAALNSGNSGGPLINCYGQVIGINTMKISTFVDNAGVEGLGFAIPSTTVKEIVDQLISQGYVSGRPTLGITGESISRFYMRYYGFPAGLYITEVDSGSDAAQQGIQPGDILLSIDSTRITDMDGLNTALYSHQAGDTVKVSIYRAGMQYNLELKLAESKG